MRLAMKIIAKATRIPIATKARQLAYTEEVTDSGPLSLKIVHSSHNLRRNQWFVWGPLSFFSLSCT